MQGIPVMLRNRDLIGISSTGSGKSLAFIFPLLFHTRERDSNGSSVRAIVLAPSKELSYQIYNEFVKFCEGCGDDKKVLLFGPGLKENPNSYDIIVSTPKVLIRRVQAKKLGLENVQYLVFDEADALFDSGLLPQIDQLIKDCTHVDKKISMWSATMVDSIQELADTVMQDPVRVEVGQRNASTESIDQKLIFVGIEKGKILALKQLIEQGLSPPILVFVETRNQAEHLFKELILEKIRVDMINSDRPIQERDEVIKSFRRGETWVLITTDLLARGMDFKGVNCVINYDFPKTIKGYIHRIGRTGRMGRKGTAYTLYTTEDIPLLRSVAHVMKASGCQNVPEWMLKLNAKREKANRFKKRRRVEKNSKTQ
eukprot:TRINITY_DN1136_c0_g1_i1.p1 TRINITY_DN1136_c0_g1~~TRINITY_DN1136_c0_g1_i1.p1  ORF type:complete len:370 (+),score=61.30 TRINITY_DN1136_c0_g1_i1:502-1611(+)